MVTLSPVKYTTQPSKLSPRNSNWEEEKKKNRKRDIYEAFGIKQYSAVADGSPSSLKPPDPPGR